MAYDGHYLIDMIVMNASGGRAQFVDECLIPMRLYELNEESLALHRERGRRYGVTMPAHRHKSF